MDRSPARPAAKNVLRKLNNESLAAIERGLVGELPIRLRSEKHKVRGLEQQIVSKHPNGLGLISGCFPTSGSDPNLAESANKFDDIVSRDELSPLKKTFSFKDNFGRLFRQNALKTYKKELDSAVNAYTISETKPKKFWPFKSKETTENKDTVQHKSWFKGNKLTPIYVRSKSFEFLPRAMDSDDDLHGKFKKMDDNPKLKRKTMYFDSDESVSNSMEEFTMQNKTIPVKPDLLVHNYIRDIQSTSASSLSSDGGIKILLQSDSVLNVFEEFDKTVELCENYASDSELCVTRKRLSKVVFENRKSSSFSALPSPKVVQVNSLRPSKLTDTFNWELNNIVLGQSVARDTGMGLIRENLAVNGNKRQSVTQWNVIDDIDRLQGIMAAKKAAADRKRIRRTSSTNYNPVIESSHFWKESDVTRGQTKYSDRCSPRPRILPPPSFMHRPAMACDTAVSKPDISWLPKPLAEALTPKREYANSSSRDLSDRWHECVVDWLRTIRRSIENYEPVCSSAAVSVSHLIGEVTNQQTAPSECRSAIARAGDADGQITVDNGSVHNAFDAILGDLGNEIFQLDVYQRKLSGNDGEKLNVSILNIFDECLDDMKESSPHEEAENHDWNENTFHSIGNVSVLSDEVFRDTEKFNRTESTSDFYSWSRADTDRESTRSRKSDINLIFDDGSGVPVPPMRRNRRSASTSTIYDNMDKSPRKPRPTSKVEQLKATFGDESDTESTCWSYRACSSDSGNRSDDSDYQTVWMCNSGFHKSDAIIYGVIKQNSTLGEANSVCSDTDAKSNIEEGLLCGNKKSNNAPVPAARRPESQYANIDASKHRIITHVESESQSCHCYCRERQQHASLRPRSPVSADCESHCESGSTEMKTDPAANSSVKEILFPDYGSVKDALDRSDHPYESLSADGYSSYTSCQENVYEEIKDLYSSIEFSVDGDRTLSSVEVETCESECDEDIPLYENLRDNSAYAISADVIAWKHSLWDPFGMEDEEDEWITGGEALEFVRERQPPYVIPRVRIAQPPPPRTYTNNDVVSGSQQSLQEKRRIFEPAATGLHKAPSESSPVNRLTNRLGGSNEMLSNRRSVVIHSASGSGDSLDYRSDHDVSKNRRSKSLNPTNLNLVLKPNMQPNKVLPNIFEPTNVPLMEGIVQRAKFVDNGKKGKKSWNQSYAVLSHTALAFYKDQKSYQQAKNLSIAGTPTSMPDMVTLHDALVSQCIAQQTKRYMRAFSITSGSRDIILIQAETQANFTAWYNTILSAINKLAKNYVCPNNSEAHIEDPKKTPSPSSKHRRHKKVGDSSNEDLSDPAEYSNVRSKLKKFFTKRPSMESLVRKGIYKDEPVFGRCLEEVCSTRTPHVPEFVMRCVRVIEKSNEHMQADGLYRASGNLSQVQKIRLEVDKNNLDILDSGIDVHVLTGSLKLFFRELKEPLIPTMFFDRILNASMKNHATRIKEFREIVSSLPLCNRDTLQFLLEHLIRVTAHAEHNRMNTSNLAIVFGPTLLWAPEHLAHNLAADSFRQNLVVETLLNCKQDIFDGHPTTPSSNS